MLNPFPGMNPYLEQPDFWSDFHNQLVAAIARALVPQLLPKYRVVMDKWVYRTTENLTVTIGRPDVSVQHRPGAATALKNSPVSTIQPIQVPLPLGMEMEQAYLEVKDVATQAVVTVIEVLSPANKRGDGRHQYATKRQKVLASLTHWLEIDLLRSGQPFVSADLALESDYRLLVSPVEQRPMADLYRFNLGDAIPLIPLPLRPEDDPIPLDLQTLVHGLYTELGYGHFINYQEPPPPPWTWAEVEPFLNPNLKNP